MSKKSLIALAAPALAPVLALASCTTMSGTTASPVMPAGSVVAMGQSVAVADLAVTPLRVITDSRCPINARCVWAGEIIVETRVDGAGWRETMPFKLGESVQVHGYNLTLQSAEPGQMAGADPVAAKEYRFTYSDWQSGS